MTRPKLLLAILLISLLPLGLQAESLKETLNSWQRPLSLSGPLMEIGRGYLIVSERQVMLVDELVAGRHLTTRVRSLDGRHLDLADLRLGQQLLVKGGAIFDGQREVFVVRDIWLVAPGTEAGLERLRRARPEDW